MKLFAISAVIACSIATAALGLTATANAAPTEPGNADQTVEELRADGFNVILNKVGTGALDQCTVGAVRPGQTFTMTQTDVPGGPTQGIVTTVTGMTVYVDVTC